MRGATGRRYKVGDALRLGRSLREVKKQAVPLFVANGGRYGVACQQNRDE